MSKDKVKHEDLYNIKLKRLYEHVTDIMGDFNFQVHRGIAELGNKRRIETWKSTKDDNDIALVWIETVSPSDEIDPYIGTDVLRTMNEESLGKLFFFTNAGLTQSEKNILDGKDHYVFSADDIVQTMSAMDSKKKSKNIKKRKSTKVPSGYLAIRNFMLGRPPQEHKFFIKTSSLGVLTNKYLNRFHEILKDIDKIENIDNIPPELKERFKRIQMELMPEIQKLTSITIIENFKGLKNKLYETIQLMIVYIGNIIEYEAEEDMRKNRDQIENNIKDLKLIEEQVIEFTKVEKKKNEYLSIKLFFISIIIITIALFFYFYTVQE